MTQARQRSRTRRRAEDAAQGAAAEVVAPVEARPAEEPLRAAGTDARSAGIARATSTPEAHPGPARLTKAARLQAMLAAPSGAALASLCEATGWQAHTVRAALTRLRQAGHMIERAKDEGGQTVYLIVVDQGPEGGGTDAGEDVREPGGRDGIGKEQAVSSSTAQDGAPE